MGKGSRGLEVAPRLRTLVVCTHGIDMPEQISIDDLNQFGTDLTGCYKQGSVETNAVVDLASEFIDGLL